MYDQYAEAYDRKITRGPTVAQRTAAAENILGVDIATLQATADAQAAADAQAVAATQAGAAAAGETSTVTDPGLFQQGFDAVSDLVGEGLDALSETTGITGEDITEGLTSAAESVGDALVLESITGVGSAELAASASAKASDIADAAGEQAVRRWQACRAARTARARPRR